MATRDSTRSRPHGRARSKPKSSPNPVVADQREVASAWKKQTRSMAQRVPKKKRKAADPPDLDEILGRFAEALALVETSFAVLDEAQQDWDRESSRRCCPAVHTLDHGIRGLVRVYSEVDLAFMGLS